AQHADRDDRQPDHLHGHLHGGRDSVDRIDPVDAARHRRTARHGVLVAGDALGVGHHLAGRRVRHDVGPDRLPDGPTADLLFDGARGLLPQWAARVHPKYQTPHVTTILTGVFVGLLAGF